MVGEMANLRNGSRALARYSGLRMVRVVGMKMNAGDERWNRQAMPILIAARTSMRGGFLARPTGFEVGHRLGDVSLEAQQMLHLPPGSEMAGG